MAYLDDGGHGVDDPLGIPGMVMALMSRSLNWVLVSVMDDQVAVRKVVTQERAVLYVFLVDSCSTVVWDPILSVVTSVDHSDSKMVVGFLMVQVGHGLDCVPGMA